MEILNYIVLGRTILLAAVAASVSLTQNNPSNWMGDLFTTYPAFGNKKINEIVIPGSHESGTFGMGINMRCQGRDIKGQLELGVRYFDLRVMTNGSAFYAHHTLPSSNDLGTVNDNPDTAPDRYMFKQMRDFLKAHPNEILILKYQNFKGFSDAQAYINLVDLMKKYFTFDFKYFDPGGSLGTRRPSAGKIQPESHCRLVTLTQGTAEYVNKETLRSLLKANKRVFVFFATPDAPPTEKRIWDFVFQYRPSLKKLDYALWDPYWEDESTSLADDKKSDLANNRWWNWHKANLKTWSGNGLFVLQSHMQVLNPTGDEAPPYFNKAQRSAAANSQLERDDSNNRIIISNNNRNGDTYLSWLRTGETPQLNIITFDYVEAGDLCGKIVQYYKDTLPKQDRILGR